jgi:hypothetical protein
LGSCSSGSVFLCGQGLSGGKSCTAWTMSVSFLTGLCSRLECPKRLLGWKIWRFQVSVAPYHFLS